MTRPTGAGAVAGFHLERMLGSGGSGTVHVAWDGDRQVALKLIDHSTRAEADLDLILREAMVSTLLTHPNLVPCLRCGATDGHLYLAYEYLEGGDTRQLIEQHGILSETRILELMSQTLTGLEAIHSAGYVHGDIKPSNILLGSDDEARIGDFGTAALIHEDPQGRQATPAFMAPEQATAGDIGPQTDIYAVGATAHYWACGIPPYVGTTPLETIGRMLTAPLPEIRGRRPELSVGFENLLRCLLQKAPEDRPANAGIARGMVAAVQAGETNPQAHPLNDRPAVVAVAPRRQQRWLPGLALALMSVLLVLMLWRPGTTETVAADPDPQDWRSLPVDVHSLPWFGAPAHFIERGTIRYRDAGQVLILEGDASLSANGAAMAGQIAASGDFRLDLDLRAFHARQQGPATILLLGTSPSSCNLLIGQSLDRLEIRCRTTSTNPDGTRPHLSIPGIFTESGGGWLRLRIERLGTTNRVFIDGDCVGEIEVAGDLGNWSRDVMLSIGDATRGGFGWQGEVAGLRYITHPASGMPTP